MCLSWCDRANSGTGDSTKLHLAPADGYGRGTKRSRGGGRQPPRCSSWAATGTATADSRGAGCRRRRRFAACSAPRKRTNRSLSQIFFPMATRKSSAIFHRPRYCVAVWEVTVVQAFPPQHLHGCSFHLSRRYCHLWLPWHICQSKLFKPQMLGWHGKCFNFGKRLLYNGLKSFTNVGKRFW